MKLIKINLANEPDCLIELRGNGRSYDDLKDECLEITRKLLSNDQNGYCAYCEQKFKSIVFIEHYISQFAEPSKDLDFDNFLGICSGKEYFDPKNSPKHIAHCGHKRGSEILTIDPRESNDLIKLFYDDKANIRSTDIDHNNELENTLNLNFDVLKKRRNNAYKNNYTNLIKVQKLFNWTEKEAIEKALLAINSNKFEFGGYLKYRYENQVNST